MQATYLRHLIPIKSIHSTLQGVHNIVQTLAITHLACPHLVTKFIFGFKIKYILILSLLKKIILLLVTHQLDKQVLLEQVHMRTLLNTRVLWVQVLILLHTTLLLSSGTINSFLSKTSHHHFLRYNSPSYQNPHSMSGISSSPMDR